jgi:hypothetical protein
MGQGLVQNSYPFLEDRIQIPTEGNGCSDPDMKKSPGSTTPEQSMKKTEKREYLDGVSKLIIYIY